MSWKPDFNTTPQRIACAACRHKDGAIIVSIRHFDSFMHTTLDLRKQIDPDEDWFGCEQGFVDQFGNFLDRRIAWVIAAKANQIFRLVGNQTKDDLNREDIELFSENLY